MDNSVHLHDCSPFWVGIFITFNKENFYVTVLCRHAHSDWQSTAAFLYVKGKSNILCKHKNILLSLTLKETTILNFLPYIHIVEIPTKRANSYKL